MLTARRKDGETSIFDRFALLLPLAAGVVLWISGVRAMRQQIWSENGVPVGMNFFMGSVLLLAAAGDVRMQVRGGLFGPQRIVRHLWRMCFGLFIATGSFFLGQGNKVFQSVVARSNVLFVAALLPLLLLIFWLFRLRFTSAYRRKARPGGHDVYSIRT